MAIDDTTAATPQTTTDPRTEPAGDRKAPRRRLVVCCDGTWNRADQKNITNIEKIARSVQIDHVGLRAAACSRSSTSPASAAPATPPTGSWAVGSAPACSPTFGRRTGSCR